MNSRKQTIVHINNFLHKPNDKNKNLEFRHITTKKEKTKEKIQNTTKITDRNRREKKKRTMEIPSY